MHLTKRQQEIYSFIRDHIGDKGYAPSILEIAKRFDLSSPATVHKHLTHLEAKGLIDRKHNRSRAIELASVRGESLSPQFALLGYIAAGKPIEALSRHETLSILPETGDKDVFVLRVKGNSMIEDHIQDGDYVIVERREVAENGETVVALLDSQNATLKRFYREKDHIRLQPANAGMAPLIVKNGDLKIQGVVIGVLRKFK